jgi:hypothetical protein
MISFWEQVDFLAIHARKIHVMKNQLTTLIVTITIKLIDNSNRYN